VVYFSVPEPHRPLVDRLNAFIKDELLPLEQECGVDEDAGIPVELRKRVAARSYALGFYTLGVPAAYGGMELGQVGLTAVREEIARSGSAFARFILGGGAGLLRGCNEAQRQAYLLPVIRGEKYSCFAMTEPRGGSEARSILTTAVRQGDHFALNGTKSFVTHGPYADFAVVVAQAKAEDGQDLGITLFLVDRETRGYRLGRIWNTMAGGNEDCELIFENCVVPAANVLGQVGKGLPEGLGYLSGGRLSFGALSVGTARLALDLTVQHARAPHPSGKPLAAREGVQLRLGEMLTQIYAARSMTYDVAALADEGRDIRTEAAMVKLFSTEMVGQVVDAALQLHGSAAYVRGHPIERLYRVVRGWRLAEGASEIQKYTIAGGLLA